MVDGQITPLGPWPFGVDNVHGVRHRVFQIPGKGEPPARLAVASNVDIDDEGWPRTRPQAVTDIAVTSGQLVQVVGSRLFYQANGSLYVRGVGAPVLTGLTRPVTIAEFGGRIYISDGSTHRELEGSTVRGWGLPIPTLALSAGSGSTFAAGTYLVQAQFVDARGNQGGTSLIASITLATSGAITAAVSGYDIRVAAINLYVGKDKQRGTSFATQVASSGASPQSITLTAPTTAADPPVTERMQGPPAGLSGATAFHAFMLTWRDNVVWRSEATEPHLFHPSNIMQFPATVQGVAALPTGFWVGTAEGLCWVWGDDPPWPMVHKTRDGVLKGSYVIEGWKLPFLQVSDPVALFVDKHGLLVGLPSGETLSITRDRYHVTVDSYTSASFAYSERGDLRQLLVALS
jgi:hypothetical protein